MPFTSMYRTIYEFVSKLKKRAQTFFTFDVANRILFYAENCCPKTEKQVKKSPVFYVA